MKVEEAVTAAVREPIEALGYELVDVEYVKKPDGMNLTIFIDLPAGGVSLDDCERAHRAIDPILDELDPTGDTPYILNVSSPGLDRPFKKQRDYERNYGKEVEVKLYAPLKGKKLYEGVLRLKTENAVVIETDKGELTVEMTRVACVRPCVRFS